MGRVPLAACGPPKAVLRVAIDPPSAFARSATARPVFAEGYDLASMAAGVRPGGPDLLLLERACGGAC